MSTQSEVVRDSYEASIVDDNYVTTVGSEIYEASIVDLTDTATAVNDVYYATIGAQGTEYEGQYTVTPTQSVQILPTKGLTMRDDVLIKAIPNNYGLVERIGMSLRVS